MAEDQTALRVVLLGPPGAGKGTQARFLAEDFHLLHLSTGDILREEVAKETALGKDAKGYMDKGELVPDSLIVAMIEERIGEGKQGFLLDGFPRTVGQAEALERALQRRSLSLNACLLFEIDDEEVVMRLSGRRVCSKNPSHIYHLQFDPPKRPEVCDQDGAPLRQREDDREETIRRRLEVYHQQTEPLISFYEERGILRRYNASRSVEELHNLIRADLAALRLEGELAAGA
jgi:adenylate kinase